MTMMPRLQRTTGTARVAFAAGRLKDLRQQGSAKAIVLPAHAPQAEAEVVFLNTAGGLTGGDCLTYALAADCPMLATTQTAERAYRSTSGTARLDVRLSATGNARLTWLPQETILFEGSDLHRDTQVDLGPDASFLGVESLILGRKAMGETVTNLSLRDTRRISRAGVPVHLEPLRLDSTALDGTALLGGATALASLVLIECGAGDALGPVRAALGQDGVTGAASAMDGRLVIRLAGQDGWPLRQQILRLLAVLRPGPLPRVWQV